MSRNELWDQVDRGLYQILEIPVTADAAEIQDAWRAAAKRTHPDLGGSIRDFQAAEIAYQVLSDPETRLRYDRAMPSPISRLTDPGPSMNTAPPSNQGPFIPRSQWTASWFGTWQPRQPARTPAEGPVAPPHPHPQRRWNPWLVALAVIVSLAIVIASYYLGIFTLTVLLGLGLVVAMLVLSSDSNRRY